MTQTLEEAVASYPAETPDWAVANDLNTPKVELGMKRVNVPVSEARGLLMRSAAWASIVLAADNSALQADVRAAAITGRDSMLHLSEIETSDPATYAVTEAMLGGLVAGGVIPSETRDALLALAEKPQSWSDINYNGAPVTARDVGIARGGKP